MAVVDGEEAGAAIGDDVGSWREYQINEHETIAVGTAVELSRISAYSVR
jgi:hypothetical protein